MLQTSPSLTVSVVVILSLCLRWLFKMNAFVVATDVDGAGTAHTLEVTAQEWIEQHLIHFTHQVSPFFFLESQRKYQSLQLKTHQTSSRSKLKADCKQKHNNNNNNNKINTLTFDWAPWNSGTNKDRKLEMHFKKIKWFRSLQLKLKIYILTGIEFNTLGILNRNDHRI